jgi:hypothetical protein
MGFIDVLLLVITVILIIEAVIEARRKRWLAFALSLCFIAILLYITSPVYRYLWHKVMPAKGTP